MLTSVIATSTEFLTTKATTTINSRFLFYFPGYKLKSYCKSSDYVNVLPVDRNNEVVLYNNQYINYLRTGYNYDVKAKQRTDAATGINSALAIIGAISSVGLGVASGNPLLAIGGVVAGFSTTGHAIMNMLNATAQSEQNLNSKMDQLRAQATSVAGSDDIDILEAYSDNRAKLTEYRVSDKMRKAQLDAAARQKKGDPFSLAAALKNGGPIAWLSCLVMGLGNLVAGMLLPQTR